MGTMGKIETQSSCARLNQLFQYFRATSRWADGSNNLSTTEGISQLHGVTVKGAENRTQGSKNFRFALGSAASNGGEPQLQIEAKSGLVPDITQMVPQNRCQLRSDLTNIQD